MTWSLGNLSPATLTTSFITLTVINEVTPGILSDVWTTRAVAVLAALAADQWGLVTAAQAVAAGVHRNTLARLSQEGVVRRIDHAVYQMVGATDARFVDEKVAWLRLVPARRAMDRSPLEPDGGVISHRNAAKLHGIGDLATPFVELTTPRRHQARDPSIKLRHRILRYSEVTTVDGLPVTTVERTIADLAAEHIDGGHLGDLIGDARQRGILDAAELAREIARFGASYGTSNNGEELIEQLLRQAGRRTGELLMGA